MIKKSHFSQSPLSQNSNYSLTKLITKSWVITSSSHVLLIHLRGEYRKTTLRNYYSTHGGMLVSWKPAYFTIIMIIVVYVIVQWCRHLINKHGLFCLPFFSKCISKLPLVAGYYKLKQECTSHLSLMSKQTTQPVHSLKIVNHKTGLHQEYFPLSGTDNS